MKLLVHMMLLLLLVINVNGQTITSDDTDVLSAKKNRIEGSIDIDKVRCLKLSCWYPDKGEFGGHLEVYNLTRKQGKLVVTSTIFQNAAGKRWSTDTLSSDEFLMHDSVLRPINRYVQSLFMKTIKEKRVLSNAMHHYSATLSSSDGNFVFDGFKILASTLSRSDEFENLKTIFNKYKIE